MAHHNETCGCAECGNYGQVYNPGAIHNQSCGCAKCNNYPPVSHTAVTPKAAAPTTELIAVPIELAEQVRALIAKKGSAAKTARPKKAPPKKGKTEQ